MKYIYTNPDELKSIISRLRNGESETFSIYDNTGRRVRYDFESNLATVHLVDDKVDQVNPFYKPVEEVVEPEDVEEQVDDAIAEEVYEDTNIDAGQTDYDTVYSDHEYVDDSESVDEVLEDKEDENTTEVPTEDYLAMCKDLEDLKGENESLKEDNLKLKERIAELETRLQGREEDAEEEQLSASREGESLELILAKLKSKGYVVTITL